MVMLGGELAAPNASVGTVHRAFGILSNGYKPVVFNVYCDSAKRVGKSTEGPGGGDHKQALGCSNPAGTVARGRTLPLLS